MFFSRFIPCLMIAVETTAVTTRKYESLDQTFGDWYFCNAIDVARQNNKSSEVLLSSYDCMH